MASNSSKQRRAVAAAVHCFAQYGGSEVFTGHVPGRINGFFTVMRTFAVNALSPGFNPLAMKANQQDTAVIGPAKAGFKKMHQRHEDLAQRNCLDFNHGCLFLWGRRTSIHPNCQEEIFRFPGRRVGILKLPGAAKKPSHTFRDCACGSVYAARWSTL